MSADDVNCPVALLTFLVPIYALLTGSFRQRLIFLHRPLVQEHATNKIERAMKADWFFVGRPFKFGVDQQKIKFFAHSALARIVTVTKTSE